MEVNPHIEISKFSKVSGHKINIQKAIVLLHYQKLTWKLTLKKTIPFIITEEK